MIRPDHARAGDGEIGRWVEHRHSERNRPGAETCQLQSARVCQWSTPVLARCAAPGCSGSHPALHVPAAAPQRSSLHTDRSIKTVPR